MLHAFSVSFHQLPCDSPHHFSVFLIFGFVMKLGGVPDGRMKVLPCVLSNLCHTFCKHCAIVASACLRWSISLYHFRESRTLDAASLSLSVSLWCFSLQFYRPVCKSHITKNRSEQPISIADKRQVAPCDEERTKSQSRSALTATASMLPQYNMKMTLTFIQLRSLSTHRSTSGSSKEHHVQVPSAPQMPGN